MIAQVDLVNVTGHELSRSEKIFYARMKEAKKSGPMATVEVITPAFAAFLLERNENNRQMQKSRLAQIVRAIKEDRFELNGATIVVSVDGKLNDGQNRCKAVIEAGRPIKSFVVWGVERDSRFSVDNTMQRKAGQLIQMHGLDGGGVRTRNETTFAAIAKMLHQWVHWGIIDRRHTGLSAVEIFDFYCGVEEKIAASWKFVNSLPGAAIAGGRNTALITAHCILSDIDSMDADEFIGSLQSGEGLSRKDVIYVVRDRILRDRARALSNRQQIHTSAVVALIFHGWNLWRRNEHPSRVQYPKSFPTPK